MKRPDIPRYRRATMRPSDGTPLQRIVQEHAEVAMWERREGRVATPFMLRVMKHAKKATFTMKDQK